MRPRIRLVQPVPARAALVAAALLAACAPVGGGGASPGARGRPAPGEVVYDTDVRLDLQAGTLDARSTLRLAAGDSGIALLLNRGLRVEGVTGPAVRSFRVSTSELTDAWNVVRVELAEGVAPGTPVELEVAWSGAPVFPSDTSNRISPAFVELNLDGQWHPVVATLDHGMTGVVRIALPREWQVAASGASSYENGAHVVRTTIPQVDVAFLAAPSFTPTRSGRFTALDRAGAGPAAAAAALEAAEACAAYLDRHFGARDPLPRGTLVLAGRTGPGYARKNYIVLSQFNPADSVGAHGYLCHELAHYWTRSAGPFTPHHWMLEAMAEYSAARFLRQRFGEAAYRAQADRWEQAGRAHGPVWTPELTRRPSFFLMYRRGPWLLSRLEERIGTERFDAFLRAYMTEGVRTTPELLERLEAVAGAEATQWFRDELARGPDPAPAR